MDWGIFSKSLRSPQGNLRYSFIFFIEKERSKEIKRKSQRNQEERIKEMKRKKQRNKNIEAKK